MDELLMNTTRNILLAEEARSARTFFQRAQGLLGKKNMRNKEALYIPGCRSIHTFFMKFNIDVAFTNAEDKVVKIVYNLKPFRILWGPFSAKGVWEMKGGALQGKLLPGETLQLVEGRK